MKRCKYFNDDFRCYAEKDAPLTLCEGDPTECSALIKAQYDHNDKMVQYKKELYVALRDRFRGYVEIYLLDDDIRVDFYYGGDINYSHIERGITVKADIMDPEALADKVIYTYKKVLMSRYFKK